MQATDRNAPNHFADLLNKPAPRLTEDDYLPAICASWFSRARALSLPKKGAKRDSDRAAFLQGTLAALTAAGIMSMDRAGQIGFLVAVSRDEDWMQARAAEYGKAAA